MKLKYLVVFVFIIFNAMATIAQDTVLVYNNYKYKIGIKFIADKSTLHGLGDREEANVYSEGIQIMRKIKESNFFVESGLYYYTQANVSYFVIYIGSNKYNAAKTFYYRNISTTINLRYDTRLIYLSTGISAGYLMNRTLDQDSFDIAFNKINNISDRKLNIGLNFSIGMEKQFNKNISFFIDGHYLQNLTSVSKSEDYDIIPIHFKNYGFSVGINYKLLK